MGFLNLGRKDEHSRQRRIEHRGKYLRASRTGGVALRAQAKAAGVSLTANTAHGFRVSATPLKGTQLGFQNGRFILRGRYGSGPTKLNVSKTGLSVSTRNRRCRGPSSVSVSSSRPPRRSRASRSKTTPPSELSIFERAGCSSSD